MTAKKRTCLKCGDWFDSSGPGNRICSLCAKQNARIAISEETLQKQRGVKRLNGNVIDEESVEPQSWEAI